MPLKGVLGRFGNERGMTARLTIMGTASAFWLVLWPWAALSQDIDIAAACAVDGSDCAALVDLQIAALQAAGLTGDELDAAIGQIAASVYAAAQITTSPSALSGLARAIKSAADQMSNVAASNGLRQAANAVAKGEAATTRITAYGLTQPVNVPSTLGVSASPN